jgi:signal transduction histidine kinase
LQEAFERQARFTADASHELRTPLAIIRSNAQLALERPRSADDYRQTVQACLRSAERMTTIVAGLLALARADAGWPGQKQTLDFAALVEEVVAQLQPLATSKGITISADLTPVMILGDAAGLHQLVGNLTSNAIQYNRANGTLKVGVKLEGGNAVLTVSDSGDGIPEADRPFIFERFYRVDKARSRSSGGTGLGLAICKGVVEAHNGTIGFDSIEGHGTTFWVRLPVAHGS